MQQSSRVGGSHETSFTPMISTAKPGWNYLSHNQWGNLVPSLYLAGLAGPDYLYLSDPVSRVMSELFVCHHTNETETPPAGSPGPLY